MLLQLISLDFWRNNKMKISDQAYFILHDLYHETNIKQARAEEDRLARQTARDIEAYTARLEKNQRAMIKNEENINQTKELQDQAAEKYQKFLKKSLWTV